MHDIGQIVYTLRDYRITEVMKCKVISVIYSSKGISYNLYDVDRDKKYDIAKNHKDVFETRNKAQHYLAVANLSGYYAQKLMNKHLLDKGTIMKKVNSEPEDANWWKNKSNFPCMLIAETTSGDALVWVHYQINGIAYDVRDNGYRLIEHTNWRRATKEEILANIKGL